MHKEKMQPGGFASNEPLAQPFPTATRHYRISEKGQAVFKKSLFVHKAHIINEICFIPVVVRAKVEAARRYRIKILGEKTARNTLEVIEVYSLENRTK